VKLRTLYTAAEVEATVHRLADEITRDLATLLPVPDGGGSTGARPSGPVGSGDGGSGKGKGAESEPGGTGETTSLTRYPDGVGKRSGLRAEIDPTFSFERPLFIGLLKGTFVFLADLVRAMRVPVDIDFMRARLVSDSYGGPAVEFEYEPQHSLEGRALVVVEDVAGSGRTLPGVLARLKAHAPHSIRVCALVRRRGYHGPSIDYVGYDVGPGWLVGYGLDDREALRNLPGLCVLED
jgi:hypoxanthine phosphoribosyltransferase